MKDNNFFRWTKLILWKFRHVTEIVYMGHSEEVLINYFRDVIRYQGSLPPQENGWVVAWNSSFWHSCVPWNIWQPQSSIEEVNNFVPCIRRQRFTVPCIRRQRFTRIVKAPKRISCHLELGNLSFHVPYHVQTYVHRDTPWRKPLQEIVAVVVYIFYGFPIKPQNFQPKNKLPC